MYIFSHDIDLNTISEKSVPDIVCTINGHCKNMVDCHFNHIKYFKHAQSRLRQEVFRVAHKISQKHTNTRKLWAAPAAGGQDFFCMP